MAASMLWRVSRPTRSRCKPAGFILPCSLRLPTGPPLKAACALLSVGVVEEDDVRDKAIAAFKSMGADSGRI
jgi:hypothetical protein